MLARKKQSPSTPNHRMPLTLCEEYSVSIRSLMGNLRSRGVKEVRQQQIQPIAHDAFGNILISLYQTLGHQNRCRKSSLDELSWCWTTVDLLLLAGHRLSCLGSCHCLCLDCVGVCLCNHGLDDLSVVGGQDLGQRFV